MNDQERDTLLMEMNGTLGRLDERFESTYRAVFGNGRPGLVSAVAVLEDDMRRREAEADELRKAVPTKRSKALINSGVLTALLIAVFTAARTVFGF